jgi:hypothetical protein
MSARRTAKYWRKGARLEGLSPSALFVVCALLFRRGVVGELAAWLRIRL